MYLSFFKHVTDLCIGMFPPSSVLAVTTRTRMIILVTGSVKATFLSIVTGPGALPNSYLQEDSCGFTVGVLGTYLVVLLLEL